jgi:hypothetical protein
VEFLSENKMPRPPNADVLHVSDRGWLNSEARGAHTTGVSFFPC